MLVFFVCTTPIHQFRRACYIYQAEWFSSHRFKYKVIMFIRLFCLLPWSLNADVLNMLRSAMASLPVLSRLVRYLGSHRSSWGENASAMYTSIENSYWTIVVDTLQIFSLWYITASLDSLFNQISTVTICFTAALFDMESSNWVQNFCTCYFLSRQALFYWRARRKHLRYWRKVDLNCQ